MIPFDKYPGAGGELLGYPKGGNCRHEYGLKFMLDTGETCCAYCGADFTSSYQIWLSLVLDHVVPKGVCRKLGICDEWREDLSNYVLACGACNGFCNRYSPKPLPEFASLATLADFHKLRDQVFIERKELIRQRHETELAFFEQKRWNRPSA